MHVLLSSELHYLRGPDGHVYTDSLHPYRFWTRYHRVFEQVAVVGLLAAQLVTQASVMRVMNLALSVPTACCHEGWPPTGMLRWKHTSVMSTLQGGGAAEIGIAHAGEEIGFFLLEAVFFARLRNAAHGYFQRHIQKQG